MKRKKLRIAIVSSSDPQIAGGVQEHIIYLTSHLRNNGHTVDIYGPEGLDKRFINYHPISKLIDIPTPGNNYTSITTLHSSFKYVDYFKKKKYDLVHIHEPYFPLAAWTIIDSLTVPAVATFHTAWDNTSPLNLLNSFIPLFKDQFSKRIDSAIFVSPITQKRWKDLCAREVYQTIIPNAVDINEFKPKNSINSTPIILFAARLVSRKGVLHLLQAAKILKERGTKFEVVILGDGKDKNDLIAGIKAHKLGMYVHYLGEIKANKRFKYFTSADIFCAPYINEAAPLTILEAISAGLPIVGFMNESFRHGLANYPAKKLLVKCNDLALANALQTLLSNKGEIERIKKWCIAQRESYSWEMVTKQTEAVYYHTIANYEKKNI
jgi:phosphatidylinositol alpha-mannosyltransferase